MMDTFNGISRVRLNDILEKINNVRIALIGDICLDVYWKADMTKSELSRETPHFPLPVVSEYMSPGAGGNAAANIAALKPASMKVLGVVGKDWRGDALLQKLKENGIDTEAVVVSKKAITNAYCKPIRKGISLVEYEDPRIDFTNYENLPEEDEAELLERLDECAGKVDILCVSDQLLYGCITPKVRERIISYAKQGLKVVVDSRDRIGLYKNVILKPNEIEGLKAVESIKGVEGLKGVDGLKTVDGAKAVDGIKAVEDLKTIDSLKVVEDLKAGEDFKAVEGFKAINQEICIGNSSIIEEYSNAARILAERNESAVCMTLGSRGCLYTDSQMTIHIPSHEVTPPIDICGAGDTFLSAFSCALAAGAEPCEAASFANLAAEVTVGKVGVTGTANREEIMERYEQVFR